MKPNVVVNVSDSKHVLDKTQKLILERDAQEMVSRYSPKYEEANLVMHVKSHQPKNLVHVRASLITDKKQYHAASEEWRADLACQGVLSNIKKQLMKDRDQMVAKH